MFEKRRRRFSQLLQKKQVDAAVIVPGPNMYYLTGLKLKQSERLAFVVITNEGSTYFIVPQVELTKAESVQSEQIFWYTDEQGPAEAIQKLLNDLAGLKSMGIEYGQMRVMELKAVEELGVKIEDVSEVTKSLRIQKDDQEIALMRQAVSIVEESLEATLPYIQLGVTEVEVAAQLEFEMRKRGSEGTPFGTIVASGYRGATPHGRAGGKQIERGDLIVMDFGATYQGYVADICRTFAMGNVTAELKEIYDTVRQAQQAAVDIIQAGVPAHEIDETARKIIADKGYGDYFTHRTGHGLGLEAHEEPYMMQNSKLTLQPGMAFTVEPGIYVPNVGGVRIEDNIVVTEDGHSNLMTYNKNLIVL